jgi:hypothetical protein
MNREGVIRAVRIQRYPEGDAVLAGVKDPTIPRDPGRYQQASVPASARNLVTENSVSPFIVGSILRDDLVIFG